MTEMNSEDRIRQILIDHDAERERKEFEDAKKITWKTIAAAAILGFLFPIVNVIIGIYHLYKGRRDKGLVWIVVGAAWWILFIMLSMGSISIWA